MRSRQIHNLPPAVLHALHRPQDAIKNQLMEATFINEDDPLVTSPAMQSSSRSRFRGRFSSGRMRRSASCRDSVRNLRRRNFSSQAGPVPGEPEGSGDGGGGASHIDDPLESAPEAEIPGPAEQTSARGRDRSSGWLGSSKRGASGGGGLLGGRSSVSETSMRLASPGGAGADGVPAKSRSRSRGGHADDRDDCDDAPTSGSRGGLHVDDRRGDVPSPLGPRRGPPPASSADGAAAAVDTSWAARDDKLGASSRRHRSFLCRAAISSEIQVMEERNRRLRERLAVFLARQDTEIFQGFFQNYFSIGADAAVAKGVEEARSDTAVGKCTFGLGLGKLM